MAKKNVVIAGGGTGGHIYPGISLAEYLQKTNPDVQVHFVGAYGGLEEKIVPHHNYPLHLLRAGRLHHSVSLLRRLKSLLLLPWCFVQSCILYFRLRPQWVLGVGGFASGPFVLMASLLGGKTAILEPNAYPGMANRYLSKVVDFCFMVFDDTQSFFPSKKVHVVGLPIRFSPQSAKTKLVENRPLRILVFGGSQGARAINDVVGQWLLSQTESFSQVDVVHQVGGNNLSKWQEAYGPHSFENLEYTDYLNDMPERLAWADLCICRAGIGTVAEVAMSRTPALFIPLPTAADNHQFKNAETLQTKNAGLLCEQSQFTVESLENIISGFLKNPSQLVEISQNLESIDYSKASHNILSVLSGGSIDS